MSDFRLDGTKITKTIDWANHGHFFCEVPARGGGCYSDMDDVKVCHWCEGAANASTIPNNKHYEHPKGCQCYYCVECKCEDLRKREKESQEAMGTPV